jgi:acyl-CoA reductase-like NAD-dependent aldehyde dehydrogenase
MKSSQISNDVPLKLYINGEWRDGATGDTLVTFDPATGHPLAEVSSADQSDVDAAVLAARSALAGPWGHTLPAERGRTLNRTAAIIRRESRRLAFVESLDSGKPLREANSDIETAARYFEYYAGVADKLQGNTIPLGKDLLSFTLHEPVGVTAHIVPWNFPLVTTARGLAPALAAGNTAVVKPAEETPLTALFLGKILAEAGLPGGVYNAIAGTGEETGAMLVAHPYVAHVTFTGSVETGKRVMKAAADHIASVILELGGKSPIVVLADADMESAVEGILKAIFTNASQACSAGSRLVVERPIADAIVQRLTLATQALTAGRGIDDPHIGPLISPQQLSRVAAYVTGARERGANIITGGHPIEIDGLEGGWFYEPTLLAGVDPRDPLVQEEVFGPVLTIQIADSPEEALRLANGTSFGLVAGVYTRDISRALRFARDIDAGQVFINQYFVGGVETPFGGPKNSGFGREKGLEALRNYIRVKSVTARI